MAEVPITLHPDGRKSHAPHLKTFRDGWRTMRFFMLYSPRWLFLMPGAALILIGLIGYGVALPGLRFKGVTFDAHTLLFSSLAMICGFQSVAFALCTKVFAMNEGLLPPDPRVQTFFKVVTLERSLLTSGFSLVCGAILLIAAINKWRLESFGSLDYAETMRMVIPGATLTTLGLQLLFSSFYLYLLRTFRHNGSSPAIHQS